MSYIIKTSRYYIYVESEFHDLLFRLAKADISAVQELISWLENRYPEDARREWLYRYLEYIKNPPNKYYPQQSCLDVLTIFGIHPCSLCWGCNWPKMKINKDCQACEGTGFYHSVEIPPGNGFTLGWAPGIVNIVKQGEDNETANQRIIKESAEDARQVFKRCYPESNQTTY